MINDDNQKDVIGFEMGNHMTHLAYRHLQLNLQEQGYDLSSAEKFLNKDCPLCGASHHLNMVYRKDKHEREFLICVDCWTVHELKCIWGIE